LVYQLNEKVFLVKGAKKSCIYDLRNQYGKIYWFPNKLLSREDFLDRISYITKTKSNYLIKFLTKPKKTTTKINFAWIEVTSKCNINCQYCYIPNKLKRHMSYEEFTRALNFLKSQDCNKIQIIGGEPFYHPNILTLLKKAADYGFKISIYTNGLLLNENIIDFISSLKIAINIGIPPFTIEKKEFLTILRKNISLTKKVGTLRKVSTTITQANYKCNFKEILGNAYELFKPDIVRINSPKGLKYYNIELLNKKLITINTFRKPVKSSDIFKRLTLHNCFAGRIYITSNLEIFPCPMVRDIKIGKIESNNKNNIELYKSYYLTKDKIFICRKCEFRYACFDCRYEVWGKNSYNRPWYCTYNPLTGKWISSNIYIRKYLLREGSIMQEQNIVLLTNEESKTQEVETVKSCSPGWCSPIEE